MSKVSSKDCVNLLVELVKKNPDIVTRYFDFTDDDDPRGRGLDEVEFEMKIKHDACNPRKWKRAYKMKVSETEYDSQGYVELYERGKTIPNSEVVCLRIFALDPKTYDSSIAYYVVEDKSGNVHLGQYAGD